MSSHLLRTLGHGSTLPGKIALQVIKDILHSGNCSCHWYRWGKPLTQLSVGILKAFGPIVIISGANMISGLQLLWTQRASVISRCSWNRWKQPISDLYSHPDLVCEYITSSAIKWTATEENLPDLSDERFWMGSKHPVLMNEIATLFIPSPTKSRSAFGFIGKNCSTARSLHNTWRNRLPRCHGILTWLNLYARIWGDYICESCDSLIATPGCCRWIDRATSAAPMLGATTTLISGVYNISLRCGGPLFDVSPERH